jgi:hypothetical protein
MINLTFGADLSLASRADPLRSTASTSAPPYAWPTKMLLVESLEIFVDMLYKLLLAQHPEPAPKSIIL